MTTSCTKTVLAVAFFTFGYFGVAQQSNPFFFQPQVVFSGQFSPNYDANFGVASRFQQLEDSNLNARFLELSHFSSWRMSSGQKISIGLLYRFAALYENTRPNEFRLTQQYQRTLKPYTVRFSHRLRLEERFIDAKLIPRFRYRFGIDFPLNGQELNVGEAYALANVEALLQLQNSLSPKYDYRALTGIGVLISPDVKLQVSLQYRAAYISNIQSGRWFAFFGGYVKI